MILFCAVQGGIGSLAFTTTLSNTRSHQRFPTAISAENKNHDSIPPSQQQQQQHSSSRRQWLTSVVSAATAGTSLLAYSHPALAASDKITPTASICDPTVSVWERNGRIVYLLGTAHISDTSAQLAGQLVRDTHPDAVFIELDLKRIGGTSKMARKMEADERQNSLSIASSAEGDGQTKPTRVMISPVGRSTPAAAAAALESSATAVATTTTEPTTTTATPVIPSDKKSKTNNGGFLQNLGGAAVGQGIRGLYSKLGSEGFNPGEEFVVAIREGQKQGAAIVLGDQDVDVTLRRMATAFQQTDLSRLMNPDSALEQSMREMVPTSSTASSSSPAGSISNAELSAYVETIKTKDNVKKIMSLMKNEVPALYQVMVTERDAYMAAGLNTLNEFAIITAVMGLAHVDGVETNLRKEGWRRVPLRCPVKA